jgi:site-specific recombinase XerD
MTGRRAVPLGTDAQHLTVLDTLPGWRLHLRAKNLSPTTIGGYLDAAGRFASFLSAEGLPVDVQAIERRHVEAWEAHLLDKFKPATAANRHKGLTQYFRWLDDEGEIERSPMLGMRVPKVPESPVPLLTDRQVALLLGACKGSDFLARRDAAIFRMFLDTGARLSEVANLRFDADDAQMSDIDLDAGMVYVLGKGRRPRAVPIGSKAQTAIDRYLRMRHRHVRSGEPWLWLGHTGHLSGAGIQQALKRRLAEAGLPSSIHPHMLRHLFAHNWQAAGGNESALMTLMGWRSPEMLRRYGSSAAGARAIEAHRRMDVGGRY